MKKNKMKGNESPKYKNEKKEGPKSQNERKWRMKRPKWKEIMVQKGKHESKWCPRRPKWKEIKAQRVSLGVAYLDPISKMAHKTFKITQLAAAAFKSEMCSHNRSCPYMSYLYRVLIATQLNMLNPSITLSETNSEFTPENGGFPSSESPWLKGVGPIFRGTQLAVSFRFRVLSRLGKKWLVTSPPP